MGAKRYFVIVWLAFAVPWVVGTGFGVYDEARISAEENADAASASCTGERKNGQPGAAAVVAECPEKAIASLTGRALDAAGTEVQTDSSRSADTVKPVHGFVDGAFVLGPPLLLFIVYCLFFLVARLAGGERKAGADDRGG